jgi:dienelactone hydrolase
MSRTLVCTSHAVCLGAALLLLSGCGNTVKFPTADPDHPGSVSAHFARPTETGPFPAVVLLHGGTGVEPKHLEWSAWLVDQGYVAIVVDSLRSAASPTVPTMVGDAPEELWLIFEPFHLSTAPELPSWASREAARQRSQRSRNYEVRRRARAGQRRLLHAPMFLNNSSSMNSPIAW